MSSDDKFSNIDRILFLSNPVIYGSDVEELQEYLSRLGFYSEPINSTFDSNVSKSVRLFQENRGLSVDGTVGLETAGEIRRLLRPTMKTSLNEAVKSFKGRTSNFSICFIFLSPSPKIKAAILLSSTSKITCFCFDITIRLLQANYCC